MHYYQFHIGDYKSHTSHLSVVEDCAYRRLLDFYYLNEKAINHRDVARQINMREHEQDVLTILNEFFISTNEGFVHPRADQEIAKYKEFIAAGKRGAAKRWASAPQSQPNGEANSPPTAAPIATINHKPITNNHIDTPDGVSDSVWQDFKAIRKSRKAPITQRVVDGLRAEAEKAGWTFEQALNECCLRGWQSFKADWLANKTFAKQDIVHTTVPSNPNRDPALAKLDADQQLTKPPSLETLARLAALRQGIAQ
jgi:uncharacterized protein YdaU (DUF1376 family)